MSNWQTKKLREVCEIVTGGTPKTSVKDFYGDEFLWAGPSDLNQGVFVEDTNKKLSKKGFRESGIRIIPKDSVMMSCIGYIGKVGIAREEMATNQQINTFIPNQKILDSKYLYYSLIFKAEEFQASSSQTTLPIINKTKCSNIEIPLPPLSTQKEIVKMLDEKMRKIGEAKRLRAEALVDTEKILPQTLREIFDEGKQCGWEEKEIQDVCEHPQYGFTASSSREPVGPKMLRITDIQDGGVDWEGVPYCKCASVEKYELSKGDLVFARTGATVGKSFLIADVPKHTIYASYLIRLRAKENILPEFLYYFFQSPDYWGQISDGQVGAAQPNVNGSKLAKLKLLVPPLAEQKKIVARLDTLAKKVRALRDLETTQLADLKSLDRAYLREAFAGRNFSLD